MAYINRDWARTEHDDYELNILPQLDSLTEAVPVYHVRTDSDPIGWIIQPRYE